MLARGLWGSQRLGSNKCLLGYASRLKTLFTIYQANTQITSEIYHKSVEVFRFSQHNSLNCTFLFFSFFFFYISFFSTFTAVTNSILFLQFLFESRFHRISIALFLIIEKLYAQLFALCFISFCLCLMCKMRADFCVCAHRLFLNPRCLFITQHCHFVCHSAKRYI